MDISGKRVVVMGLGRFGGGVGVTQYLVSRGADVLVTDLMSEGRLQESLSQLRGDNIRFRLGEHDVGDFTAADLIVVNPAVDLRSNIYLQAAGQAGVAFTSEIRMLVSLLRRDRVIGVTGTAGKSTVTAMIGHMVCHCLGPKRVYVGGNLGGSLLGCIDRITSDDWVVLELSSFMLEGLAQDRWSPHVAVATNFKPNHLDRHGSVQAYAAAKQSIFDYQDKKRDRAVLGPGLDEWMHPCAEPIDRVEVLPAPPLPLLIPGRHNQLNAALAIRAVRCAGLDADQAAAALADFAGLPHRLQRVCEHNGVRYFNDSKATTPEAAILAIDSFVEEDAAAPLHHDRGGGIHMIMGGYDKKSDLASLARHAGEHCVGVYTIGTTGGALAEAAQGRSASIYRCGTLDQAVEQACQRACPGDVVLLSPGCASWDQFDHYEARGAAFGEAILKYNTER